MSTPQVRMSLLTVSALLVSSLGLAQEEPAAQAAAAEEAPMAEVTIRGENIPDPMVRTPEIASFVTLADLQRHGRRGAPSRDRTEPGAGQVRVRPRPR
jgi:hypothetical protein